MVLYKKCVVCGVKGTHRCPKCSTLLRLLTLLHGNENALPANEPGRAERIESYRLLAEQRLPLFESREAA